MVVGDGAAQLLSSAAYALMDDPLDELVTPWPCYPPVPGDGPPRPRARGPGAGLRRRRRAQRGQRAHARRRAVLPERPDGRARGRRRAAARCSRRCPSASSCCSTRRSRDFADAQPLDAALELLDDFPRLLVLPLVLEGLGPGRAARRLRARRPGLRAAARAARARARRQRARPGRRARGAALDRASRAAPGRARPRRARAPADGAALRERVAVTPSQANFVWLEADGHRRRRARTRASTARASASPAAARSAIPSASASRSTTPRPRTGSCARSTARWAEFKSLAHARSAETRAAAAAAEVALVRLAF